jgi:muconolactone delta-isomerase
LVDIQARRERKRAREQERALELESQGRTMRLVLDKSNHILKEKLAAEILLHAKDLKSSV